MSPQLPASMPHGAAVGPAPSVWRWQPDNQGERPQNHPTSSHCMFMMQTGYSISNPIFNLHQFAYLLVQSRKNFQQFQIELTCGDVAPKANVEAGWNCCGSGCGGDGPDNTGWCRCRGGSSRIGCATWHWKCFQPWVSSKTLICFNMQLQCFVGSCGQSKGPSRTGSTEQLRVVRSAIDQIRSKSLFIHLLIQPVQKSTHGQVLPNTQITCGDV